MIKDADKCEVVFDFRYPRSPTGYLKYQSYYLMGINTHPLVRVRYRPTICALMVKLIQHNTRGAARVWGGIWCNPFINKDADQRLRSNHVGRYILKSRSHSIRIAIDSEDTRGVRDTDALQWSDIYFKTNKWHSIRYPEKVFPLINGNGSLTHAKIKYLKSLRNVKKDLDLIYWAKIWEPKAFRADQLGNIRNLIEHQIRLFETLAGLQCKKSLIAILPEHLKAVPLRDCKSRLESAGVRWQHGWGNISSTDLWQGLASAKIVFLRPGNHLCISWRMTDLLCMGACVVYDGVPFPQWYKPINEGEHYLAGDCRISADYSLPPSNRYLLLKDKIADILSRDSMINRCRENAARYFDRYGEPQTVAQHILDISETVGHRLQSSSDQA